MKLRGERYGNVFGAGAAGAYESPGNEDRLDEIVGRSRKSAVGRDTSSQVQNHRIASFWRQIKSFSTDLTHETDDTSKQTNTTS
ncbi:hypothetical protein ZHAS_00017391 [Anopheles sinensis]|uniref:Uncharacterized protein n=1 Tax=Anopheles sinensis TaxID=74873 RepID=A0A084WGD4_ANOSI|nr:hypothetical protein ZHAS_00017391 [Anopheles sinensis]